MEEIKSLYKLFINHPTITTDSRNCPEGSIFIALKGASFNGNAFAKKAIDSGCEYAVVDEEKYAVNKKTILVKNGLKALQKLAIEHRKHLNIPVIGITGTNGKTTTKELVTAVLSKKYNVLSTQGNLNNHIGVPLTLLRIKPEHDIAIIEMGANHPGEIKDLSEIADPDYGIITNIGKAHIEGFGSIEEIIRTKTALYKHIKAKNGTIFINADNEYLTKEADNIKKVEYSLSNKTGIYGNIDNNSPFLEVTFYTGNKEFFTYTKLIGKYNLENILAAVCIGNYFKVSGIDIANALCEYTPQNNRSQLKETGKNTLIIDAYNANPTSMKAALENFNEIKAEHKAAILGSMGELGPESHEEHRKIIEQLKSSGIEKIMLIGKEFDSCKEFKIFPDTGETKKFLLKNPLNGYYILIKGSRANKLEEIIDIL